MTSFTTVRMMVLRNASDNADCPTPQETAPQDLESSPVRRQSRPAGAETTRPRLPAPPRPLRVWRSSAARVPRPPGDAEDRPRYIVQRRVALHTGVAPACTRGCGVARAHADAAPQSPPSSPVIPGAR